MYTNEEAVIEESMRYLRVVCFSYLFYCVTEVLISSLRCVETVGIGLYLSICTLIVNVCLNYVFIFGKLGMPRLGVAGAAVATLVARVIETGIMLYYVKVRDQKLRLKARDFFRHSRVLLKDYIRYGIPIFAGSAMWGINSTVQSAIIGRLGESAISAVSISNNLFEIISVAMYGVSSATGIIIGKTVGSGDYDLVKQYAKTLQLVFCWHGTRHECAHVREPLAGAGVISNGCGRDAADYESADYCAFGYGAGHGVPGVLFNRHCARRRVYAFCVCE